LKSIRSALEFNYGGCISLSHSLHLLQVYGIKSFADSLNKLKTGSSGTKAFFKSLTTLAVYNDMAKYLDNKLFSFDSESSHPKLAKLKTILIEHFEKYSDTRVIVFTSYRFSVDEITDYLKSLNINSIRPCKFMGKGGSLSDKNTIYKQKDQLETLEKFKSNDVNCLVSTCIGEEGFDIGEVDLIVCFDAIKSPLRLIQRMGRTGRKRDGKIVALLTEGVEEINQNFSENKKREMKSNMYKRGNFQLFSKPFKFLPPNVKIIERYVY
ncbi:MAG: hypothetical protein MHPSP_002278, partial [Paramarteilia canceri]